MQLDLLSWREPEPDPRIIVGLQLNEIGVKRAKYQESRSLVREGTVGRHARYVIKIRT